MGDWKVLFFCTFPHVCAFLINSGSIEIILRQECCCFAGQVNVHPVSRKKNSQVPNLLHGSNPFLLYICTYIYYTYIYTYIYTHIHIHIHIHIRIHIHLRIHIHIDIDIDTHIHIRTNTNTNTYRYRYTYTCMIMYPHMYSFSLNHRNEI